MIDLLYGRNCYCDKSFLDACFLEILLAEACCTFCFWMISINVLMFVSLSLVVGKLTKVIVFTSFILSLRTSLNYMITTSSLIFFRSRSSFKSIGGFYSVA